LALVTLVIKSVVGCGVMRVKLKATADLPQEMPSP